MRGNNEEDKLLSADREAMVSTQLEMRGISHPGVLSAMRSVPRHLFVPEELRKSAHQDSPLEIGESQTISQPYIVALMIQSLDPGSDWKVLEVGSGSGYVTALLARVCSAVYGVERNPVLAERSRAVLGDLGYGNIEIRTGDGILGWPEMAPFNGIIVSAAAESVPEALVAQLVPGGKLVIPLGMPRSQRLVRISKDEKGAVTRSDLGGVLFVPLIRGQP